MQSLLTLTGTISRQGTKIPFTALKMRIGAVAIDALVDLLMVRPMMVLTLVNCRNMEVQSRSRIRITESCKAPLHPWILRFFS